MTIRGEMQQQWNHQPRAVPNELVANEPVLHIVITVSFPPAASFALLLAAMAATEFLMSKSFSARSASCHSNKNARILEVR